MDLEQIAYWEASAARKEIYRESVMERALREVQIALDLKYGSGFGTPEQIVSRIQHIRDHGGFIQDSEFWSELTYEALERFV